MQTVLLRVGVPSANRPHLAGSVASRHALGTSLTALSGGSRLSCPRFPTASRRQRAVTSIVHAAFDLNFNPLGDWGKPPQWWQEALQPRCTVHARSLWRRPRYRRFCAPVLAASPLPNALPAVFPAAGIFPHRRLPQGAA